MGHSITMHGVGPCMLYLVMARHTKVLSCYLVEILSRKIHNLIKILSVSILSILSVHLATSNTTFIADRKARYLGVRRMNFLEHTHVPQPFIQPESCIGVMYSLRFNPVNQSNVAYLLQILMYMFTNC